jgi:hypothetical protein
MVGKVEFASAEWISAAQEILADLAASRGRDEDHFSVCEQFTDAPESVAAGGLAAWSFQIRGKTVEVRAGVLESAEVMIRGDYATTLPIARLVYTPEYLAERQRKREAGELPKPAGDWTRAPTYLTELHNRLAVITA